MAAGIDGEVLTRQTEDMNIDTLVDELGLDGVPYRDSRRVLWNHSSFIMTLPKKGVEAAGHSPDDLGSVETYLYRDAGILIIDLNNE